MPGLVVFFVVLSILVLIHEFGHYAAAKLFGIKVEEFALGLPFTKPIFSFKKDETAYSIYPMLFGGFVRMHGEENDVALEKDRSFWNKGKKQRMMVILAGVIMNLVLALVAFSVLYVVVGVPVRSVDKVTVTAIAENSPAKLVGLAPKDRIVAVEGKDLVDTKEFRALMKSWAGLPVQITIVSGETVPFMEGIAQKDVSTRVLTVTPRVNPPAGEGALGVEVRDYPYIDTARCGLLDAMCYLQIPGAAVNATAKWAGRVVEGLRGIGKSLLAARAPEGVSGPIGIYKITGLVAGEGLLPLIELLAILSVNLAVFNVLPIPALDGGRMAMVLIEWVRRKRVTPELEQKINSWGMMFLLGLVAIVSLQDILNLDTVRKLFGN